MNKENKKQAQERRAAQRQKEEHRKKRNKLLAIWIPIAVVVIILIAIGVKQAGTISSGSKAPDSTSTNDSTDVTTTTSSDSTEEDPYLNAMGYSTNPELTVADGDTVNIDYVGTLDGVPFDGGSTGGSGTELTIGSRSYIDDFEEQLIGSHPGDTVDVAVTFPEDYGHETLNGQDVIFEVTINGIYQ